MSFWDFIPKLLPSVITAGATVYGVKQASDANNKAAKTATQATQAGTAAELAALEEAKKELQVNRNAASPGLLSTQEIIARGAKLTPEQEMAVADSRDLALNSLKGSSLRGSAKATSAIVSDVDTRNRNNFMSQNQQRADSAAMGLAGQYFGAGTNIANNSATQGKTASQGLMDTGTINASNQIGQGALRGQAIGDVGAIIADSVKDNLNKKRDSSYDPITWNS